MSTTHYTYTLSNTHTRYTIMLYCVYITNICVCVCVCLTHSIAVQHEKPMCQSISLHDKIKWMSTIKVDRLLQEQETKT